LCDAPAGEGDGLNEALLSVEEYKYFLLGFCYGTICDLNPTFVGLYLAFFGFSSEGGHGKRDGGDEFCFQFSNTITLCGFHPVNILNVRARLPLT